MCCYDSLGNIEKDGKRDAVDSSRSNDDLFARVGIWYGVSEFETCISYFVDVS